MGDRTLILPQPDGCLTATSPCGSAACQCRRVPPRARSEATVFPAGSPSLLPPRLRPSAASKPRAACGLGWPGCPRVTIPPSTQQENHGLDRVTGRPHPRRAASLSTRDPNRRHPLPSPPPLPWPPAIEQARKQERGPRPGPICCYCLVYLLSHV